MTDVTYRALAFPLAEAYQQTLRQLAGKVRQHYADPNTKTILPKAERAYAEALKEIDVYVAQLRDHVGIETTRPSIRAHQ